MSTFLIGVIGFLGFVVLVWALGELGLICLEAFRFRYGVKALRESLSETAVFPYETRLQKKAAAAVSRARSAKRAADFHPERDISAVRSEFGARLSRIRALAGLLIIAGLLFTLTNLSIAVSNMQNAVSSSAAPSGTSAQEPNTVSTAISSGIGSIAEAAGKAFAFSGVAIGSAFVLLFVSAGAQGVVNAATQNLSSWLLERYDALTLQQAEEPQDTSDKLAYAASVLVEVAKTFRETSDALTELKSYGGKLEEAAQSISTAIAAMPERLNQSMTKLRDDVAVGISDGLKNQGQYLMSLVAIYSEHAIMVSKTVELISRIAEANKNSSEALSKLGTLPDAVRSVAASAEQSRAASQALAGAVFSLDEKVKSLPSSDLAKAAGGLSNAAQGLTAIERSVASLTGSIESQFEAAIDKAARRSSEAVAGQIKDLDRLMTTMRSETSNDREKAEALRQVVLQVRQSVNDLSMASTPSIEMLRKQLDDLMKNVDGLPSLRLQRIFRSNK